MLVDWVVLEDPRVRWTQGNSTLKLNSNQGEICPPSEAWRATEIPHATLTLWPFLSWALLASLGGHISFFVEFSFIVLMGSAYTLDPGNFGDHVAKGCQ